MNASNLCHYALGVCAAAMLADCGRSSGTPLSPSPAGPSTALTMTTAERTHLRPAYNVIYSFKGGTDGADPVAGLIKDKGTLYGTTEGGGTYDNGTVFAMTTAGKETALHSFGGSGDGVDPDAALLNVNGTLYGTTTAGGVNNQGTVFAIATSGKETLLHSFGGGGDGADPEAGLLNVNGTLYGTTFYGGAHVCGTTGCGTVFSITPLGAEKVLRSFRGYGDGAFPYAGLLNVKGTLYGTTFEWGANGLGTVFSITPSGRGYKKLHSFGGSRDGRYPYAALLNVKGTLYGTTQAGGAYCSASGGCGTIFSITTSGSERIIYRFKGGLRDGEQPYAGLLNIQGTLYGTTLWGGANGAGTVFSITPSGKETLLHDFKGGSRDGLQPYAGLLSLDGTLYGTTYQGGANGYGTVFALRP